MREAIREAPTPANHVHGIARDRADLRATAAALSAACTKRRRDPFDSVAVGKAERGLGGADLRAMYRVAIHGASDALED